MDNKYKNNEILHKDESRGCISSMCNPTSESLTFEFEVFDHSTYGESSSDGLEIVTSDAEQVEEKENQHKRKRKRKSSKLNVDRKNDNLPDVLNNMEDEIERQLDTKAAKTNLTVANVKNILKNVITNEHVLAMVRNTIKDKSSTQVMNDDDEDICSYEPKLTRAKAKELMKTQPAMAWAITPMKTMPPSECQVLIEQDLPEDSSDEEYHPHEEEQEEDQDQSEMSDMDSQPLTPASASTSKPTINDISTQTSWTEDGIFRVPQENIGQRTRSKFSLSDTPLETIELAFIPPDITTDMYNSECDNEDWSDFLTDFTKPLTPEVNDAVDDDEADPEYNILADEEKETVDKEELREDKGVKVSKKELNALVAELFEYTDLELEKRSNRLSLTTIRNLSEIGESNHRANMVQERQEDPLCLPEAEEEVVILTSHQQGLLNQQMRQHVQLTTQLFIQSLAYPQLLHHAKECKASLFSLKYLAGNKKHSAFQAANLFPAIEIVEVWEKIMSKDSPQAKKITDFVLEEVHRGETARLKRKYYMGRFPRQMLNLISRSSVFMYPLLLPEAPFRLDQQNYIMYFPPEDHLLAIGLEEFYTFVKSRPVKVRNRSKRSFFDEIVKLIVKYMMPGKDERKLLIHINKAKLIKDNPVQYFYEYGNAPPVKHYVIPFTLSVVQPPNKQPKELLPEPWRSHIYSPYQRPGLSVAPITQAYRPP